MNFLTLSAENTPSVTVEIKTVFHKIEGIYLERAKAPRDSIDIRLRLRNSPSFYVFILQILRHISFSQTHFFSHDDKRAYIYIYIKRVEGYKKKKGGVWITSTSCSDSY